MIHVLSDPKPHLPDSKEWTSMIKRIYESEMQTGRKAELLSMLWTLRDMGTVIRGNKLVPLVCPGCWESEQEYKDCVVHLKPYGMILKNLLERTEAA